MKHGETKYQEGGELDIILINTNRIEEVPVLTTVEGDIKGTTDPP